MKRIVFPLLVVALAVPGMSAQEAKKADEASAEKETKTEEDPIKTELETKKKELLEATVRLNIDGREIAYD